MSTLISTIDRQNTFSDANYYQPSLFSHIEIEDNAAKVSKPSKKFSAFLKIAVPYLSLALVASTFLILQIRSIFL